MNKIVRLELSLGISTQAAHAAGMPTPPGVPLGMPALHVRVHVGVNARTLACQAGHTCRHARACQSRHVHGHANLVMPMDMPYPGHAHGHAHPLYPTLATLTLCMSVEGDPGVFGLI